MKLFTATVVENETIMPATSILTLKSGRVARGAMPGQFLHIRCSETVAPLLRRPMSIYRTEEDKIQLMVRNVGEGSGWLTKTKPGAQLNCLGPQGHGFKLSPSARNLLMVGGGYGVAPLVGLAEKAILKGANVVLAVGAATQAFVFPPRLLPAEVEYVVATEDGSAGHHGLVTELVPDRLPWADSIFACGPLQMMAALAWIVREQAPKTEAQVAMEERMGCSVGVCLGCVIDTKKGPLRVCREGPVFDMHDVLWRDEFLPLFAQKVAGARPDQKILVPVQARLSGGGTWR